MDRKERLKNELEKYGNLQLTNRFVIRLVWILYKIPHFNEDIPIQEFWRKQYFREFKKLEIKTTPNKTSYDQIIIVLKESRNHVIARKATLDDKVKNLLTLTGASIPFITVFLGTWPGSLFGIIGLLLLISTIFLLLTYWGILTTVEISVDSKWLTLSEDDIKQLLIDDLQYANHHNNSTVDFLADLFRAARFFFVGALLCLVLNVVINHFSPKEDNLREILDVVSKTVEKSSPSTTCVELLVGKCKVDEKLFCPM